jgi:hypothetical protein
MTCDCEYPALYKVKQVAVRKLHRCVECGYKIEFGVRAEKVDALWDGSFQTIYTCLNCVKVRDFIKAKYADSEDVLCCHGEIYDFLWGEGLLFSEQDIEEEASEVLPNYNERIGVVRGKNCIIASKVDWLIRRGDKFFLVEESDRT